MRRAVSRILFILFLLSAVAFGQSQPEQQSQSQTQSQTQSQSQSLADLARASRAKQQSQEASGTAPKVMTNQDVAPGSEATPSRDPMTKVSGAKKPDRSAEQNLAKLQAQLKVSEQWKARLQEQEAKIADLQARIDRTKAQIQAAVGTASYDTPANRFQAVQNEKLAQMQDTLAQEQRKLASMQDEARRAGAGQ